MAAPLPHDETHRLRVLSSYEVLDTPPEAEFDEIAALAAQVCATPIALISLVDESRQWFKSHIGTDLAETPRARSFCAFALSGDAPLIVEDTARDERFADNPLVTAEPHIRFYAGAPLVTPEGAVLGTLCVIDRTPRTLEPEQIRALTVLAREVMTHLELRRNVAELREREAVQRRTAESQTAVLDAVPAHIALIDARGIILSVNESWRRFATANAVNTEDFYVGRNYLEVCDTATGECSEEAPQIAAGLRGVLAGDIPEYSIEYPCHSPDQKRWFRLMATPLNPHHLEGAVVMHVDITGRKLAEDQMSQSRALLRIASRTARLGGWTLRIPERTLEWSDQIREIHEVPPDYTPTLEEGFGYYPPEYRNEVTRHVEACIDSGTPFDLELEIITAKGRRIWVRALGEAVRDAAGTISQIQGAFQDITSRKRVEEEQRLLAERLTSTLESITDGFLTVGPDWHITYVNAEAERMTLRQREELIGTTLWEAFPETLGTTFEREYRRALDEQTTVTFEEYFPPLEKWFEVRVYPSEQGLGIYFRDVTEVRGTREILRASEERFRTVVETAPEAIFIQTGGRFAYANAAALRLYGVDTAAELIGRPVLDFCHSDERLAIAERIRRLNERREAVPMMDHLLLTRSGETRHASVSAVPFIHQNQPGALVFARDLTESKKLEQQFLRAQRMESIGTLAGGIAHDLNNVLAPILMSIDLLRMQETDPGRLAVLATIEGSTRRGADMVGQVLSFARGVEGRQLDVQLGELLGEVEKIANETFLKSVQVHREVPAGLWTVRGDPTKLHQVLLNLCVNARDAMPSGGKLRLSASNLVLDEHYAAMNLEARSGRHVMVEVEDTGMGMSQEIIDRIFEPFFSTKDPGKGTGLGLSTTLAIIKSHGGFVRVYSEPGRGTRFRIYLPAAIEETGNPREPEEIELPRGEGEWVLVVDDEPAVRQVTAKTLEAFGYRVLLAGDGNAAASLYADRRDEIAIVLTDMMMPGSDGPATIGRLMEINPQVKIIAASGLNTNGMAARAVRTGVKHFLSKPYTAETLLKALKRVLREMP